MKPKFRSLFIASTALLSISPAYAATFYWDVNGTGTGFSSVVGTWNGTNAFWNDQVTGTGGTPTASVGSTDDLNIVAATTNTGIITLSGARAASSITFASGVGSVTMSGAGSSLALGGTGAFQGIFKNSASAQTISTAITLASAATLDNSGAGNLSIGGATASTFNLNGFALTVSGTGVTTFDGNTGNVISGAGGLIKNGSGSLILSGGQAITHTFTGGITLNGGSIRFQTPSFLGNTNNSITITDGYLGGRYGSGYTWAALGNAATNNIQITGGTSGFSGEGSVNSAFQIGGALSVLKWGASGENGATGFFNASILLLGGDQGMNTNSKGSLNNAIDLNGTTRTITSLHSNGDGALTTGFTISGAISNSAVTAAGLIKTGVGNIIFNAANTYNGGTTISGGTLTINSGSNLGTNVNTNNVSLAAGTRLNLSAAGNTGANQTITLTSTASLLSTLGLGYVGVPAATIAQADTNGGLIAINVAAYNANLTSTLTGKNFFLGSTGTGTFSGTAAQIAAGAGNIYRIGGGGGTLTISGTNVLTGSNSVVLGSTATNGTGTVSITGSQDYTGGATLNAGTTLVVAAGAYGGFGSGTVTFNGGTLSYGGGSPTTTYANDTVWNAPVTMTRASSGTPTSVFNGDIVFGGNTGIVNGSTTIGNFVVFNGDISETGGSRSFTVSNGSIASSVTFNGASIFSGNLTGTAGTALKVGGSGFLGSGGSYAGNITGASFTHSSSANQTLSGNITGTTTITKDTSASSILTLSGANTASGIISIASGTVRFAKQTALYNNVTTNWTAARINVKSGGTLAFNVGGTGEFTTGNVTMLLTNLVASSSATNGMNAGSNFGFDTTNAAGGTFTISNVIADSTGASGGARGLTKLGTGALVLSNTNNYSGATVVSAGTLYVTGAISGSAVTVDANGAIGSNGSPGILGNGLTISAGGDLDLTGAALAANSNGILGITSGNLTLGNLTFQDLIGWNWMSAATGTYELIDGAFTVDFGSTAYISEATAYDFGNGNKGYFTSGSLNAVIVAIPEPNAAALLGALGTLLLLRRRR